MSSKYRPEAAIEAARLYPTHLYQVREIQEERKDGKERGREEDRGREIGGRMLCDRGEGGMSEKRI